MKQVIPSESGGSVLPVGEPAEPRTLQQQRSIALLEAARLIADHRVISTTSAQYEANRVVSATLEINPVSTSAVPRTRISTARAPKMKKLLPNGTIFFREDRQKWVGIWNGFQEAARDTPQKVVTFFKNKYLFSESECKIYPKGEIPE